MYIYIHIDSLINGQDQELWPFSTQYFKKTFKIQTSTNLHSQDATAIFFAASKLNSLKVTLASRGWPRHKVFGFFRTLKCEKSHKKIAETSEPLNEDVGIFWLQRCFDDLSLIQLNSLKSPSFKFKESQNLPARRKIRWIPNGPPGNSLKNHMFFFPTYQKKKKREKPSTVAPSSQASPQHQPLRQPPHSQALQWAPAAQYEVPWVLRVLLGPWRHPSGTNVVP